MESLKGRMQARDDAAATPPPPPAKATTTVAARVRPWLTALDGPNDIASTSAVSATGVRVRGPDDAGRGRGFRLHHAVSADDATFCDTVIAPLADLASRGGTACVVFYGASGAGKTHSARAAQRFAAERLLKSSSVDVSFLEIAGEACCDLLKDRETVKLLADASGAIQPVGLSKNQCASLDDFDAKTKNANKLRATAATERNSVSSRSHAVCQLKAGRGRLRLVDLAGSERLKAGAENYSDERLREAQEINSSLSCLNECLRARLRGDKHVPYRRAKITLLLRDALEVDGATSTAFVACVSPSPATATESKRTLEYAAATLEASELARQRKQFKGPEKWSSKECEKWCLEFDGGKYAKLAPAFCKSGKTLAVIYRGDLLRQVEALGGSEADCEVLYMAFRKLVKDAKKKPVKRSAVALKMASDARLLRANKEKATASDRFGGAGQDELQALAEKHEGLNLG